MIYIFEFDIVPGKTDEFFDFMKAEGAPFWTQFEEVDKYEVFMKLGAPPCMKATSTLKASRISTRFAVIPTLARLPKRLPPMRSICKEGS